MECQTTPSYLRKVMIIRFKISRCFNSNKLTKRMKLMENLVGVQSVEKLLIITAEIKEYLFAAINVSRSISSKRVIFTFISE